MARLGLGTAQFGLDYGISNASGRPTEAEAGQVLALAREAGIGMLDTAPAYGGAEELLGRLLRGADAPRIVSKTPPLPEGVVTRTRELVLEGARRSCERLQINRLDGLLVHKLCDLFGPNGENLLDGLRAAKERGYTAAIGVSVYDEPQINRVLARFTPDIVQLPINALDRRLERAGCLDRLKSKGIEIHARSVFLQGLLLMPEDKIPSFFTPVAPALAELRADWRSRGMTALSGCLDHVLSLPMIDLCLVGVNSRHELEEITKAMDSLGCPEVARLDLGVIHPRYLDPSVWPEFRMLPSSYQCSTGRV